MSLDDKRLIWRSNGPRDNSYPYSDVLNFPERAGLDSWMQLNSPSHGASMTSGLSSPVPAAIMISDDECNVSAGKLPTTFDPLHDTFSCVDSSPTISIAWYKSLNNYDGNDESLATDRHSVTSLRDNTYDDTPERSGSPIPTAEMLFDHRFRPASSLSQSAGFLSSHEYDHSSHTLEKEPTKPVSLLAHAPQVLVRIYPLDPDSKPAGVFRPPYDLIIDYEQRVVSSPTVPRFDSNPTVPGFDSNLTPRASPASDETFEHQAVGDVDLAPKQHLSAFWGEDE